jgi:hypothetical protein
VRAELRRPITSFDGWGTEWSQRIIPPPPPKPKAKPTRCANGDCPNPRESKLKQECVTCRKWRERHNGEPRPLELAHDQAHKKAGDPTGTRSADVDRLIDDHARFWLTREQQHADGDERRAAYAHDLARDETYTRVVRAGIGGDHPDHRRRQAETDRVIENYGSKVYVDQKSAKALWKAVERRYQQLSKEIAQ